MCAGVDKRAYIRTSTRYARASCVSLTFRVRGTCERNAPELQKGLAPHKVTICVDRSIVPVDRPMWSILPWAFFSPEYLIRWTGDGGHLFRCVLALRQCPALCRLKLQPSVVTVRHHCAKSEELQINFSIKHQKSIFVC